MRCEMKKIEKTQQTESLSANISLTRIELVAIGRFAISVIAILILLVVILKHPLISCERKSISEHPRLLQQLGVSLDEGSEPVLWHVGGQVVEHAALSEQGMRSGLDGVGLEVAVHAEAFAGGTEQGEQDDGEGVEQQQAVAPLGVGDANCAEAEAQVLGVAEAGLHCPPLRVELDDLRRGRVTAAGHQGSFMPLACTHTAAPTGHCASVASRNLRARPSWPTHPAAGRVVPSAALTLVLPLSRMT